MSDDKKVGLTLTDEDMMTSPKLSRRTLLAGVGVALGTVALAGRSAMAADSEEKDKAEADKAEKDAEDKDDAEADKAEKDAEADKTEKDVEDKDKADAEADKGEAERDAD